MTVDLNRSKLALKYYGPAHTDSDISITFPEADILHCGDTYWNGIYPFIDYSTGGNIDGMIKAAQANVAAVTDKTIVIPGHGQPVSNKAELTEYRDMLVAIHSDRNIATGNPYKDLISDLQKRGVKVELCGATAKVHGWGNEDLLADIKVNTDAMARTTQLVQQGFVKITE
jgi:intracellular sulfur oxidation DsrE/DsrF family protein